MSADMESDHEEKRLKKSKRKHRNKEETSDKMDVEETPKATDSAKKDKKKHKEKKRKERSEDVENDEADVEPAASPEKKHKKHKSADEKKEKKHSSEQPKSPSSQLPERPAKQTTGTHGQAAVPPKNREYPFFTQTFSQRVPIWPASFDEPLTKTAREYLDPMLNRYSPKFKGVLLEYKNVNLSHRPQRADPKNPPTDDTPVLLQSVECYAPPFAWLTADLHLFIPSRGAWMEGEINLQSEGHIGVVCFEKFNASISRRSLPKGWTWVDQPDEDYVAEEEAPAVEEDPFTEKAEGEDAEGAEVEGGNTARDTHQLRSSGHWVDENGDRVSGKVHFRIKNFSSGSTGDFTYLSLQGTMLDDESEKKAVAEERELEKARRARQNPSGLLYPTMRLPEFSMTKLKDDLV